RREKIFREALLPKRRRKEMSLPHGMSLNPLQNIDEIRIGVNLLVPAGSDKRVEDSSILCPDLCPVKHIVLSSNGIKPVVSFNMIRIEWHLGIIEKHPQGSLVLQSIRSCLEERI